MMRAFTRLEMNLIVNESALVDGDLYIAIEFNRLDVCVCVCYLCVMVCGLRVGSTTRGKVLKRLEHHKSSIVLKSQ